MRTSKIISVDADKTLIKGLTANFTQKASFVFKEEEWSAAETIAALKKRVALAADVDAKEIAWRAAVKAEREKDEEVQPLRVGLKQMLSSRYGADAQKLKEFGFAPAKARKVTVETKAQAQKQAQATRDARKTMGKKQKKGIKGVVAETQSAADSETETSAMTSAAKPATGATSTPAVNGAGTSNGQNAS